MDGSRPIDRMDTVAPHWTFVCDVTDIPRLGARVLQRSGDARGKFAIFRTADDRIFALLDRCPHKGGPLSEGIVHGDRVTCPLHNWNIALPTGAAIAPDEGCAARFPVRVEAGRVYIALTPTLSRDAGEGVPSPRVPADGVPSPRVPADGVPSPRLRGEG